MTSSLRPVPAPAQPNGEPAQRLAQELVRSNAELQAFAYTTAHDLREPLRTISAFTQLLIRRVELDEANEEIARVIVDGVHRLTTIIDSLLASAVHGFNEFRHAVDLQQVASQAILNLHEAIVSSHATISLGPLPIVEGNEGDLVRLFQNLISNAIKYRSEAPVVIRITAEHAGAEWIIRVQDNGTGIPKAHQRRIFGLFRRGPNEAPPGTGLGLTLCKRIVEGMGGLIWVESEPGAGSTFCFTVTVRSQDGECSLPGDAPNGVALRGVNGG